MINIIEFFDTHIFGIFITHLIISFFLALVLSKIALKRYVENSDEVIKKDKSRLDEIAQEGIVFKTLFKTIHLISKAPASRRSINPTLATYSKIF